MAGNLSISSEEVILKPKMLIRDHWEIIKKIGGGGFGEIYSAKDLVTNKKVAVKVEKTDQIKLVLKMEVAVLKKLNDTKHACKFYGSGKYESFNYIVMSLQGKNLSELRKSMDNSIFSIPTTIRLCRQILSGLKDIHEVGFLHRDVKPANFAMGRFPSTYRNVYMLDYGLSRQYLDKDGNIRIPRSSAGFRGTLRYASYNAHLNKELGRHDDLFSLIYVLIEMLSGQLPWKKIKEKDEVGILKQTINSSILFQNMPQELEEIYLYVQNLSYFDKPDYEKIETIFDKILTNRKMKDGEPYDWENAIIINTNISKSNPLVTAV